MCFLGWTLGKLVNSHIKISMFIGPYKSAKKPTISSRIDITNLHQRWTLSQNGWHEALIVSTTSHSFTCITTTDAGTLIPALRKYENTCNLTSLSSGSSVDQVPYQKSRGVKEISFCLRIPPPCHGWVICKSKTSVVWWTYERQTYITFWVGVWIKSNPRRCGAYCWGRVSAKHLLYTLFLIHD